MNEFFTFITYSAIGLSILLIVLLLNNIKAKPSNKILLLILIALLLLLITYTTNYIDANIISSIVSPIGTIIPIALGPLLFNYINSIYDLQFNKQKIIRSFIPFGTAFLCFSIPKYIFGYFFETNSIAIGGSGLIVISGFVYFIYKIYQCFKILKEYRKQIKDNYSYTKNIDLKWVSSWVNGLIIFIIIDIISGGILLIYPSLKIVLLINLLFLSSLIWYLGYFGLNQTKVFLFQPVESSKIIHTPLPKPESNIKENSVLKNKIETLFKEKEIYKQQNLSLRETALLLHIPEKKLSAFINTELNQTFYELVNSYRIQYFKKSIKEGVAENLTLLAIAFDAGFNSKATFNRVFKQQEGITPLQFKKSVLKKSHNIQ